MAKKIKVALGTIYPIKDGFVNGGVEAVAHSLINNLSQFMDIDLHVVSCNSSICSDGIEKRGNFTIHWIKTSKKYYLLNAITVNSLRVGKIYKQLKPDVIHVQGFSEYAMAVHKPSPLILTIHGVEYKSSNMMSTSHFKGVKGFMRRELIRFIVRKNISNATAITSNSGDYVPSLLREELENKKIAYIFNSVAKEYFKIGEQDSTKKVTTPYLVWAGQISERKNLIFLIQVLREVHKQIPSIRLVIIGNVSDEIYFERLKSEIETLRMQEEVLFPGHLSQSELLDWYTTATIMVMPSLEETAPMMVAQAMAAGKSVVASRVGGIPWMVADGINGLLASPFDVSEFSDKILSLLQNPELRKKIARNALNSAKCRFSPESVAEQTRDLYFSLLKGGNNK
jgi:glycosyltransferase involved in cell wall biosynthesis